VVKTYSPSHEKLGRVAPTIRVSPTPYRIVLAAGLIACGALLLIGATLPGAVGLAFAALFAIGVRERLRGGGAPALARRGDELVGSALREPLPVAGTTFSLVDDHEGSWLIELHRDATTIRLSAGGWRVDGEGRVTRTRAPQLLERLGLRPRA
jgi:hypothetical protein